MRMSILLNSTSSYNFEYILRSFQIGEITHKWGIQIPYPMRSIYISLLSFFLSFFLGIYSHRSAREPKEANVKMLVFEGPWSLEIHKDRLFILFPPKFTRELFYQDPLVTWPFSFAPQLTEKNRWRIEKNHIFFVEFNHQHIFMTGIRNSYFHSVNSMVKR